MSVNDAGGRSLGITGRPLHDVLEDTVMTVTHWRDRDANSVNPQADRTWCLRESRWGVTQSHPVLRLWFCVRSWLSSPTPSLQKVLFHEIMQDQQHLLHDEVEQTDVYRCAPWSVKANDQALAPIWSLWEDPLSKHLLQNYFLFSQNICKRVLSYIDLVVLGVGHCHGPGSILLRTTSSIEPYFQNPSKYNFVQFLQSPLVFLPPAIVSGARSLPLAGFHHRLSLFESDNRWHLL